jgi:hypothetical protein
MLCFLDVVFETCSEASEECEALFSVAKTVFRVSDGLGFIPTVHGPYGLKSLLELPFYVPMLAFAQKISGV